MLKNLCLIFLIKKILCFIMKFTTVLENRIKTKKIHRLLEFKLKLKGVHDVSSDKEMYDFSKSKYYDNSNKLLIGKMNDETGVAIEGFVGLKPKIYLFLVDNSEHKKAKDVNKNVVATISHNEYKDKLLNKKCIRH